MKKTLLFGALIGICHANDGTPITVLPQVSATITHDFNAPKALSTLDNTLLSRADLDSAVRAQAGTFSTIDPNQGTLQINVRGMSGLGRVNTLIDDVPQTFFGVVATSEGEGGFHSSPPSTSSFGTLIDANFLTQATVSRGSASALNANTLIGNANFKTIDISDITQDDHGKMLKIATGNNHTGHSAMAAIANKAHFLNGDLGVLLAISGKNTSTDFRRADGTLASSNDYAPAKTIKPRALMAKLEYASPQSTLKLTKRDYQNNIGGRQIDSRAHTLNLHHATPFFDVAMVIDDTHHHQSLNKNAKYATLQNAQSDNHARYFALNATQKGARVTSTYGITSQINHYTKNADGDDDAKAYTVFAPQGSVGVHGIYWDNAFKIGKFDFELGALHTRARIKGHKPACGKIDGVAIPCFPMGSVDIDKKYRFFGGRLLASYDGTFSPFINFSRTQRVPNVQEMFFNNEAGGSMNPFLRPETATTREIGINIDPKNGFGLKAAYFHTKIKDYIYNESFFLSTDGKLTDNIDDDVLAGFHAKINVNAPNIITTQGVELAAQYQHKLGFLKLAYTGSSSNQPINANSGHQDFGYTAGATDRLPKRTLVGEMGAYIGKFKLSAQMIRHSAATRLRPDYTDFKGEEKLQPLPKNPVITHLYGEYQHSPNLLVRMGLQNAFNKRYIEPLHTQNSNNSQLDDDGNPIFNNEARGRTLTLGIETRF